MATQEQSKVSQPSSGFENGQDYFDAAHELNEKDPAFQLTATLLQIFQDDKTLYIIRKQMTFWECYVDIEDLFKKLESNKFHLFAQDPKLWIGAIGLALNQILQQRIVVRIINYPQLTAIRGLRSHDIGHFVSVKGIVLSVQSVRILVLKAQYLCTSCKSSQYVKTNDGYLVFPKKCSNLDCSSHNFSLDKHQCISTLHQRITLQELGTNDDKLQDVGRMPLTIEIELRDNLPHSFRSGEHLLVSGTLLTESEDTKNGTKALNGIYTKYILASSVYDISNQDDQIFDEQDTQLTKSETDLVNSMIKQNQLFYVLIRSLCPAIYGQELVKAGVLLCVAGGSQTINNPSRANCHCLLIGDPGQGKSQILKFVSLIAPKSYYVSGTGTTSCGLTCSVNKRDDDQGNIDAGALVMADNGICCIDEFDKMHNEHSALLEAMEQQTVTLAKSGVLCSFPARTSIVASANPTQGHYVKNKSFLENLKIQHSVLSRFDLIFLMLDHPDPHRDQKLSEHILRLHNPKKRTATQFANSQYPDTSPYEHLIQEGHYVSLRDRLYHWCSVTKQNLDIRLMKKVLVYLRKNIHPRLTIEPGKLLQEYYLKLRSQQVMTTATLPITSRQFESLIRLSQAKARLDFRDVVTVDDAKFVIQLVEESKFECFMDFEDVQSQRRGKLIIDKSNIGNLSKPKQTQVFLETLYHRGKEQGSFIFSIEQLRDEARKMNMQIGDFGEFLDQLNFKGHLIQKELGKYEVKINLI